MKNFSTLCQLFFNIHYRNTVKIGWETQTTSMANEWQ